MQAANLRVLKTGLMSLMKRIIHTSTLYTYIEGDALADKLESIAYEVQFEPTPEGGSKNKMTSKYYTKADVVLSEEEIKAGKDNAVEIYKIVEAYLLQNPDVYAWYLCLKPLLVNPCLCLMLNGVWLLILSISIMVLWSDNKPQSLVIVGWL